MNVLDHVDLKQGKRSVVCLTFQFEIPRRYLTYLHHKNAGFVMNLQNIGSQSYLRNKFELKKKNGKGWESKYKRFYDHATIEQP